MSVLPVDVLHSRLANSLQLRLVRRFDQHALILRRIVNKYPILIFLLLVEFANRRIFARRRYADDWSPNDLSGANLATSQRRAARSRRSRCGVIASVAFIRRREKLHIDAATLELVRRPHTFDVIVGSNLFGDILSDLTGGITGSLGLNPSANLNPERRFPSLFEPVHGSAPDIAGKGIANPVAAVLSAAMMMDWLGEAESARKMGTAVDRALAEGNLTPDVGGKLTTNQMTQAIANRLG